MDWWACQRWPPESGGTGSTHWGGDSHSGIRLKAFGMTESVTGEFHENCQERLKRENKKLYFEIWQRNDN